MEGWIEGRECQRYIETEGKAEEVESDISIVRW